MQKTNGIFLAPFLFYRIQGAGLGGMKPNTVILGWPNQWRKKEEDSWRLFVDTIRNTAAAKMALLVPKGVQRYPDSGDKVKGIYSNPNPNRPFFKKKYLGKLVRELAAL